jgi:hypothetical protein
VRAALFAVAALMTGCSGPAPIGSIAPLATGLSATPTSSDAVPASPSTSPVVGVRATAGVATALTVRGAIYLGFEACVGLTPDASSAYLPPVGEDDFVLVLPSGWKVVAAHPAQPIFGDHFELLDADGNVVAHDADTLEVTGRLRATEASHCGFGWPLTVREAKRVGA